MVAFIYQLEVLPTNRESKMAKDRWPVWVLHWTFGRKRDRAQPCRGQFRTERAVSISLLDVGGKSSQDVLTINPRRNISLHVKQLIVLHCMTVGSISVKQWHFKLIGSHVYTFTMWLMPLLSLRYLHLGLLCYPTGIYKPCCFQKRVRRFTLLFSTTAM